LQKKGEVNLSVLSNEDILFELGSNILIYPLNLDNIRGNTINLTASNMAWSLSDNKSIVKEIDKKMVIEIPASDTALIETRETIYVSNKLGGSYHSKVSKVSLGLGHIGTTLDPGWIGQSLIAIHNHSNKSVTIDVGESIVSVILHYLKTESTYKNTNVPGQTQVLLSLGVKPTHDKMKSLNQEWHSNIDKLREKMVNSKEFMEIKTKRDKEENERTVQRIKSTPYQVKAVVLSYIIPTIAIVALSGVVYLIERKFTEPGGTLVYFNKIIDVGLSGIIIVILFKVGDSIYRRMMHT
jgi:deoxycytidine triphosphate deaminase